jgi:uncharacterized coiled-coil protein SlyX
MFYGKRIKALEAQVAELKNEMHEMRHQMALLKGTMELVTDDNLVTMFEVDEYIEVTEPKRERLDSLLKRKENYERTLRDFIRRSAPRRKTKVKAKADGKESPATAE